MSNAPSLYLGAERPLDPAAQPSLARLPAHHLTTHAVVVGMTGSGKTGLVTVMVEEALRSGVSCLVVDVKGDLPNLMLAMPSFAPEAIEPWVGGCMPVGDTRTPREVAVALAAERQTNLEAWGLGQPELSAYAERTRFRLLTPGSTAGEPIHLLASLEQRSDRWDDDAEAARAALGAAVSLVLRLVGRDADPARSREHVLLSVMAERRHQLRLRADLHALIEDLAAPPFETVGALTVDDFLPKGERKSLAAALNSLLASPSFASWRTGTAIDPGAWLAPDAEGRPTCTVLSVAHLDDEERSLVLGMVLEETLTWTRSLPGTQSLRALVAFDEIYGFLPPHPAAPPTKRPLVSLMKQGRAFGVGLLLATQNPMDLDYRALSNAGVWCVGRLQTDADRARVVEALVTGATRGASTALAGMIKRLGQRWFIVRDAHRGDALTMLRPRQTFSFLRGPMTRAELVRAHRESAEVEA